MKPLDVINCVDYGYRFTWVERGYLVRLAAVPLLVKLMCVLTNAQLGWDQQASLYTSLVFLPYFFTEGWMLAHVSRLVFFDQRWPFKSTGNPAQDRKLLEDRAYGVMGGTVCYVLINFLVFGFLFAFFNAQQAAQAQLATGQATGDVSTFSMLIAMILTGLTIWSFRFLFLYIPAAAGLGFRSITRVPKSFLFSLQIFGVLMVCTIPPKLLVAWLTGLVAPMGMGDDTFMLRVGLLLLRVAADTLVTITSTAAVASGLKEMMTTRTDA